MKRIWAIAIPAVAIVATLTFAVIRPHITRAFTLIELPAVQYGPITVSQGAMAQVCTINWGDNAAQMVLGVVLASNTNMVLAHMEQTVPAGMGACLPYVAPANQTIAGIVAMDNISPSAAAPPFANAGNLNGSIGGSMQVMYPPNPAATNNGAIIVVCEPQPLSRAKLPAVLISGGGGGGN